MKKFLLGCAIVATGLTASLSADFYGSDFDAGCCEESRFKGFYVGGNVGVVSHTAHRIDEDGFLPIADSGTTIGTRFTGGVQVGYDMVCGSRLVGLVADWNWANPNERIHNLADTNVIHNRHRWFSTIRARAGLTVCDSLVYVTLGGIAARQETRFELVGVGIGRHDRTRWGWTGGAGAEFMLGCNLSAGLEVLYAHFGHHERAFTPVTTTFRFASSDSLWIGRATFNYRFGDLF